MQKACYKTSENMNIDTCSHVLLNTDINPSMHIAFVWMLWWVFSSQSSSIFPVSWHTVTRLN